MSDPLKACVIGWPVEHSRSPLIHRYWLEKYGIDGSYDKIAVETNDLAETVVRLGRDGYAGFNVTVPHKENVLALADEADALAKAVGAANTLWFADGRLLATNSDVYGFITHLNSAAPGWKNDCGSVAVLGAGGAARAVLKGLIDQGIGEIRLLNRSRERAEALSQRLGAAIQVHDWNSRNASIAGCGLLVNTTSLGMTGAPPLDIDLTALPDTATVADIVYAPLETDLLARARARGLATVDGLGMLLHQAAPGFEKWFGRRPDVDDGLRAHIIADLGGG
jgi:shikimate dehydrogenase